MIKLYIGGDLERKLLIEYIYYCSNEYDKDLSYFNKHSNIELLRDYIFEETEMLEGHIDGDDMEKIYDCVNEGTPLLVIRIRKGEKGYRLEEEWGA